MSEYADVVMKTELCHTSVMNLWIQIRQSDGAKAILKVTEYTFVFFSLHRQNSNQMFKQTCDITGWDDMWWKLCIAASVPIRNFCHKYQ